MYPKIQVLLSTYNGDKYLNEQISTVLSQKNVDVHLAIRDDGSTDNTKDILSKYNKNKNVDIYYGENIGYKKSFLWLLKHYQNKANYFAFCDQDDYWMETKLASGVEKLEQYNSNDYNLYFSDLIATNDNLKKIGYKKFDDRDISFGSALSKSNIPGCSMIFNNKLASYVSHISNVHEVDLSHDALVQLAVLALDGNIFYDKQAYILFRRHQNNASNYSKSIFKVITNELNYEIKNKNSRQNIAKKIFETMSDDLPVENIKLLTLVINYKESIRNKLLLLSSGSLITNNLLIDLYTKIKIIFGYF